MRKTLTIAEMSLRELSRRRGVLLVLLALPLAFYLARRGGEPGEPVRFVCLGLGWALSTAALFAGSGARRVEPRLRLGGYRPMQLLLGRLAALWVAGAMIALPYLALVRIDRHDVRYDAVALIMALTVAVAAPLGLAIATVLPRELEGTLVLLLVVTLQMLVDPADPAARLLPFWFSPEIAAYALDGADTGFLARGLLHGLVAAASLVALAAALRIVGHRTGGFQTVKSAR